MLHCCLKSSCLLDPVCCCPILPPAGWKMSIDVPMYQYHYWWVFAPHYHISKKILLFSLRNWNVTSGPWRASESEHHELSEKLFLINGGLRGKISTLSASAVNLWFTQGREGKRDKEKERRRQNEVNHTTHQAPIHHTWELGDTRGTSLELSKF